MSKYQVELITAHNGAEVLIATNTAYFHTEFDDVISAWKEQERKQKMQNDSNGIKSKIFKIINYTIRRFVA